MPNTSLDGALAALRRFDTPTICNGLELVAPERRARGFNRQPMVCPLPERGPVVGWARTATIRAAAPPPATEDTDAMMAQYYRRLEAAPEPAITVIQDLDHERGIGAFWGEVNTAIHRRLGIAGLVTDGSIRDLDMLAPEFFLLAGSVRPSHAHVRVVGVGQTVDIFGMTVDDGDLVHADRHGAVVVPADRVQDLLQAIDTVAAKERRILDACARDDFTVDVLEALWRADRDIH